MPSLSLASLCCPSTYFYTSYWRATRQVKFEILLRLERLRYHLKPADGTKVSNTTTRQAMLFHCTLALLTRGRRPDSVEWNAYYSGSRKHEQTNTQLMHIYTVQKYSWKTSQNSVLKEETNHLRSFHVGNVKEEIRKIHWRWLVHTLQKSLIESRSKP